MFHCKTSSQARTLALVVLVLLTVAIPAQAQTWVQWSASEGGNDHWYTLTPRANGWEGVRSQALAAGPGADLVSINSEAEQNFLASQFGISHLFWIGLTDRAVEGTWEWANGDAVDYTNWLGGQPDDFDPTIGGEDYAVMNFGAFREYPNSTGWNDVHFNYGGFQGIVESANTPLNVPEPSTLFLGALGGLGWLLFLRRRK